MVQPIGGSDDESYLTPRELSDRYKGTVSTRTLANWRSKGDGPEYAKIGGKVLYPLSAVIAWEKHRRIVRDWSVEAITIAFMKVCLVKAMHIGLLWCLTHPFI